MRQVGGTLIISEARVDDSGKYLCMVNNSVGGESVETVLTVTGKKITVLQYALVVVFHIKLLVKKVHSLHNVSMCSCRYFM